MVVWGLLFAAPLLSLYVRTISDENVTFDWAEVFVVWRRFVVYLLLFLLHNFFFAEQLGKFRHILQVADRIALDSGKIHTQIGRKAVNEFISPDLMLIDLAANIMVQGDAGNR